MPGMFLCDGCKKAVLEEPFHCPECDAFFCKQCTKQLFSKDRADCPVCKEVAELDDEY